MEIFQKLAGYTLGQADQVRRFMSKKKHDKLAHERNAFIYGDAERKIIGCVANGISEEVSNKLFDQMMDFASYAFNKSHAAAYAFNSYVTAWMKLYYPAEFIMAAMNWAKHDKLAGLINEAKSFGIKVKAPNINLSQQEFSIDDDGNIIFGLGAIKNVGDAALPMLKERQENGKFTSVKDFFERTQIKKDALEAMIYTGCFDDFTDNRKALFSISESARLNIQKIKKAELSLQTANQEYEEYLEQVESAEYEDDPEEKIKTLKKEYKVLEREIKKNQKQIEKLSNKNGCEEKIEALEKEIIEKTNLCDVYQQEIINLTEQYALINNLGKKSKKVEQEQKKLDDAVQSFELSMNIPNNIYEDKEEKMAKERQYLGAFVTASPLDAYPSIEEIGASNINDLSDNGSARIICIAMGLNNKKRKKDGKPMLFFTAEDRTDSIDVCVFTQQYEAFGSLFEEGNVYILEGSYEVTEDYKKFYVENVEIPQKKLVQYMMSVDSFALWHLKESEDFKKKYKTKAGHKMYIHDQSSGKLRELTYLVKPAVEKLGVVYYHQ